MILNHKKKITGSNLMLKISFFLFLFYFLLPPICNLLFCYCLVGAFHKLVIPIYELWLNVLIKFVKFLSLDSFYVVSLNNPKLNLKENSIKINKALTNRIKKIKCKTYKLKIIRHYWKKINTKKWKDIPYWLTWNFSKVQNYTTNKKHSQELN